jgi:hypothetical protein
MRLALAALILAAPAFAIELVEMKDGRLIEAQAVSVEGDKLMVELRLPEGKQYVRYAIPLDRVLPECVYYAWAGGLTEHQTASWISLAEWARANGLFRHARKAYDAAAAMSAKVREKLPALDEEMRKEEATWLFLRAEEAFGENDVKVARARLDRLLAEFGDSDEVGRAKALLVILAEREAFLTEQKRQDEINARARKHRRELDKTLDRVGKADRMVLARGATRRGTEAGGERAARGSLFCSARHRLCAGRSRSAGHLQSRSSPHLGRHQPRRSRQMDAQLDVAGVSTWSGHGRLVCPRRGGPGRGGDRFGHQPDCSGPGDGVGR